VSIGLRRGLSGLCPRRVPCLAAASHALQCPRACTNQVSLPCSDRSRPYLPPSHQGDALLTDSYTNVSAAKRLITMATQSSHHRKKASPTKRESSGASERKRVSHIVLLARFCKVLYEPNPINNKIQTIYTDLVEKWSLHLIVQQRYYSAPRK
jgi:hypothetical protein